MTPKNSIQTLEKKLDHWEANPWPMGQSLCVFTVAVLLRVFLENLAYANTRVYPVGVFFGHFPAFYFFMGLALVALLKLWGGGRLAFLATMAAVFSFGLWVPPIWDVLFCPEVKNLQYARAFAANPFVDFWNAFYNPFADHGFASPGQRLEMALFALAAALYVWHRKRSLFRALAMVLSLQIFTYAMAHCFLFLLGFFRLAAGWLQMREALLPLDQLERIPRSLGPQSLGVFMTDFADSRITSFFLLAILVLLALLFAWEQPRPFRAILRNLRPERLLHYTILAGLGALTAFQLPNPFLGDKPFTHAIDFLAPFIAWVALALAFLAAVALNDLYDTRCDRLSNPDRPLPRGDCSPLLFARFAGVLTFFSLALALCVGYGTFILLGACHLFSWIYSAPPLRLKRFFPVNVALIALISMTVVVYGFSLFFNIRSLAWFPEKIWWGYAIFFLLAVSIKDIKDLEGDRQDGAQTLMTLLGNRGGRLVIAVLLVAAAVWLPLWFQLTPWLPVSLAFSLPAALGVFFIKEAEKTIFPIYYLYFIGSVPLVLKTL